MSVRIHFPCLVVSGLWLQSSIVILYPLNRVGRYFNGITGFIFIGEGLVLGLLSWVIALTLSIPTAYAFTTQGLSLALNQQLVYQFTPTGAGLWLVIITILAIVASALPARGAARFCYCLSEIPVVHRIER